MKRSLLVLVALTLLPAPAMAIDFPPLTGRVVDEADLLSPGARAQLTERLAQHERATTNQVVVVTLKSLQGLPVEDYGYQLGRAWGIGQEKRNNGVLFIVAPNEREVRIEVGYGLEGALTDVQSHAIVVGTVLPRFKQGEFETGIMEGTDAVLGVLAGTYTPEAQGGGTFVNATEIEAAIPIGFFFLFFGLFLTRRLGSPLLGGVITGALTGAAIWFLLGSLVAAIIVGFIVMALNITFGSVPVDNTRSRGGSSWGGGGFGGGGFGGSSGGGFSGGGGSFGGGGSSGSW